MHTFSEFWIRCLVTCDSCDGGLCVSPDSTRVFIYMRTQRESLNIYMCDWCCIYFTYALLACLVLPFRSLEGSVWFLLWFVWVLCCHKLHLGWKSMMLYDNKKSWKFWLEKFSTNKPKSMFDEFARLFLETFSFFLVRCVLVSSNVSHVNVSLYCESDVSFMLKRERCIQLFLSVWPLSRYRVRVLIAGWEWRGNNKVLFLLRFFVPPHPYPQQNRGTDRMTLSVSCGWFLLSWILKDACAIQKG